MARRKQKQPVLSLSETLDQHLAKIDSGIRTFSKLTALRQNPNEVKYVQDEFDLMEGLDIVQQFMHDTKTMLGKHKYKGQATFDFANDVKENIEELYLTGKTAQENAIARKKFGAMYHLVIEPTIEMLRVFDHEQALQQVDPLIAQVKNLILNNDSVAHYEDALVSKEIVRNMILAREELRKATKRSRKRKQPEEKFVFSEYEELNFND